MEEKEQAPAAPGSPEGAAAAVTEDPDSPVTVDVSESELAAPAGALPDATVDTTEAQTGAPDAAETQTAVAGKPAASADITEDPDAPVTVDTPEAESPAPETEPVHAAEIERGARATVIIDADPDQSGQTAAPGAGSAPVLTADPDESALAANAVSPEQLLAGITQPERDDERARRLAVLEAIVYVTDEPLSAEQIAKAMGEPLPDIKALLERLVAEYNRPEHGLTVREVAGGYKMTTRPEHHEAVRTFVRNLNPPLKLSLAALETLAVIAYKQPITAPEIMEIRGVQGAGVLKTLLDRKLITTAGRKNVVGKPILYKTTKDFLVQFGLRDLAELPTLKEFEDLRRMAFSDVDEALADAADATAAPAEASPDAEERPETQTDA